MYITNWFGRNKLVINILFFEGKTKFVTLKSHSSKKHVLSGYYKPINLQRFQKTVVVMVLNIALRKRYDMFVNHLSLLKKL